MAKLDPDAVQSSQRLLEVAAAGAHMCAQEIKALYLALGLGRGVLAWRRMPQEAEAATMIEVWAYLAALMVSMVGRHRPGASEQLVQILEAAFFDAQRINCRPEYESYRQRLRVGRSETGVPDPKVFGPMYGLHQELCMRVAHA